MVRQIGLQPILMIMKERRSQKTFYTCLFFAMVPMLLLFLGPAASETQAPAFSSAQPDNEERFYKTGNGQLKYAYRTNQNPNVKIEELPERQFQVIDMHEHIMNLELAGLFLKAMDELKIQKTVLAGTSTFTFTLSNKYGFEHYLEHNEEILRIAKKYPDRFIPFPTLDPTELDNLNRLKDYVRRGAHGIKLYVGHGGSTGKGPFHSMPLDDPRLRAIYAYCQEHQLPILLHINLMRYYEEFIRVMESYPYLRICVPHFGLYSNSRDKRTRLSWLLNRYPNLYIDLTFGSIPIHIEGFENLAAWPDAMRQFFADNQDKILFGSDNVMERDWKAADFARDTLRSYMQILEMPRFRFFHRPRHLMRGLALRNQILEKIYRTNAEHFLLSGKGKLPNRNSPFWKIQAGMAGFPPAAKSVTPLPANSPYWQSPLALPIET